MFPGGDSEVFKFLKHEINYPPKEREKGIEGRVIVPFIIGVTGNITEVKIGQSVSKGIDEEAIRVVKNMPNWTPAYQDGEPVPVHFSIPIVFKLSY